MFFLLCCVLNIYFELVVIFWASFYEILYSEILLQYLNTNGNGTFATEEILKCMHSIYVAGEKRTLEFVSQEFLHYSWVWIKHFPKFLEHSFGSRQFKRSSEIVFRVILLEKMWISCSWVGYPVRVSVNFRGLQLCKWYIEMFYCHFHILHFHRHSHVTNRSCSVPIHWRFWV